MESGNNFYETGKNYWENVPPTIDGMLGGHSSVLRADVKDSTKFIKLFLQDHKQPLGTGRALDCGSGIGRITKHLLLQLFDQVDLVEQSKAFLEESITYLEQENNRIGHRFNCGLQDFTPEENIYDIIWIQWVIGYLTDVDFVSFLQRCRKGLRENGILVVKDNVAGEITYFDEEDGSFTRTRNELASLFERASLKLVAERKQFHFPKGLFEVRMFALR